MELYTHSHCIILEMISQDIEEHKLGQTCISLDLIGQDAMPSQLLDLLKQKWLCFLQKEPTLNCIRSVVVVRPLMFSVLLEDP